jgi:DNA-binding transcriptional LysR family regulator
MRRDTEARLDVHQLAALAAVIELGTFDAAEWLHVTPSAVSQRIKSLEQRVGQVLVREKPCRATAAGVPLLRLAAQTSLLESEALAETTVDRQTSSGSRLPSTLIRCRRGSPLILVAYLTFFSTSASRTRIIPHGYCARAR